MRFCVVRLINRNLTFLRHFSKMNPSTLDVILWKPHTKVVTKMDKFRQLVNEKYSLTLKNYPELYQWSVDKYSDFWETFLKFDGIVYSKSYDNVVDTKKKINEIPEWFHGSRLNYAENVLRYNVDRIAIYEFSETIPKVKSLTYAELRHRVALYANSMKKLGVKVGDRIAAYMPNCSATVEAMLAAASLGAVWSSTSPDFGVTAVLDRFTQIKPKLLFSVNAVVYNGKVHNHFDKTMQVLKGLPEVEKLIVIPFYDESATSFKISDDPRTILLDDFLKLSEEQTPNLEFEQVPFNHPLFIMFSSGTTGKPKCLVHSAGGTLIQLVKEHSLHGNCTGNDIVIYYTTVGWMMWNWLITALSTGASIVLFDGSPFLPKPSILWDLVDEIGITIFGTSAKWLALIEDKGFKPMTTHKLTSMHTVLSTGSPLKPQSYDYVYRDIKKDVMLGSITGGTDIISCFMGQNCVLPVVRGEIQSRNLGMAVESWDETGQPVYGRSGELVCVKPFPSMPIYFLNDSDGKKYHNAYFNKFPGVWHHGDYCLINPNTGGILMQGRSDGTLNPGGVRFGSADIYNIVEKYNEVEDSLCVSQNLKEGDERVVLFLKMANGHNFNEDLIQRVKNDIRLQLSARHVPAIILQTPDIPYTHNGKKVEIAVKKIISNQDVTERGALANPDSLNFFYNIAQLKI